MTSVNSLPLNEYNNDFDKLKNSGHKVHNSSFIKHRLHERKIDEFFHTNIEAPHERFSLHSLIGALAGVVISSLILTKKQKPHVKIDSFKNFIRRMDLKYEMKEIICVGLSGVIGGLFGGLADKNEKNKLNKIQEASFQVFNISFPALAVGGLMKLCEKTPNLNKPLPKIALSAVGMFSGAFLAVKVANKIDNKIFDKYNIDPDRKFKAKDFVVHIDDVFGTLALAKIPLADKLHINKILPAVFTWSGFHVGES